MIDSATDQATRWGVICGDCVAGMRNLPCDSVDAIVTDPPYALGFMGRAWDKTGVAFQVETWLEAFRVLKPGGHLLACGGSRTYHRMVCAIEDAGFEIRDAIHWIYGSGYPKSHNVGKAIDKLHGAEREVVGNGTSGKTRNVLNAALYPDSFGGDYEITAPATEDAKTWDGWGTALKPAYEPIVVARKPLSEKTVALNVLKHGTGAINVDACRIPTSDTWKATGVESADSGVYGKGLNVSVSSTHPGGRWPANLVFDEHAAELLDEQTGDLKPGSGKSFPRKPDKNRVVYGGFSGSAPSDAQKYRDTGGASKFFYVSKASRSEREAGLEELDDTVFGMSGGAQANGEAYDKGQGIGFNRSTRVKNDHPTVKPISLMRWLVRMVTPPDGVILDPFVGSGTTGVAAVLEGFQFIGIDESAHFCDIAVARIRHWATS